MQFRKIGTALVGAVFASATLTGGALAADLGDYPAPFATDDGVQSTIVVGSQGTDAAGIANDIVGAINIGAALAQVGGTVAGGAAATTDVVGAESEDLAIGTGLKTGIGETLDDNDVSGLVDDQIVWDDGDENQNLDVHEEIVFTDSILVGTGETSGVDEDFGSDVVLATTDTAAVTYKYIVEEDSDFDIDKVTEDNPLEIEVLGKSLKITDVTTDEITVEEGVEAAMGIDTKLEIDGKTLEITAIGESTVAFKVGTETEFIDSGKDKEVGDSGVSVRVDSILYTDDAETRQVLVTAGTSTSDKIEDGDSMEMFGEPADENDAEWVWGISATNGSSDKLVISAVHNQKYDKVEEPVVKVGEALTIPNDYAQVSLDSLTVNDYGQYEISFDEVTVEYAADGSDVDEDEDVVAFTLDGADGDGFEVTADGSTEETDTVYINSTGGFSFVNSDGDIQYGDLDKNITMVYEESTLLIDKNQTAHDDVIEITDADDTKVISLTINSAFTHLGTDEEDAESTDVKYDGSGVGTQEESLRTAWGTVIEEPEANANDDMVVLQVPTEQVKATVTVSGEGSSVSTTAATEGTYTPAALPATGIAKLDRNAEASKTGNLILVGGPAVNSLVAELAADGKTMSAEDWRSETDGVRDYADSAIIQAVDDAFTTGKTALVVAGYTADDTGNAAYVLQNYAKFAEQLEGKDKVTVTGTTTDAVQ